MALHARVALKPHLDRLYEAAAEIIVSKHSDLNFQLLRTQRKRCPEALYLA